jgi:glycosyltransferase involved in cell wall biosynthesis
MYAEALVRHLPPAMPEDRFVAWYLDVRGVGRRGRRFAGWSRNLSEHASRIPSRVFGPVSSRIGLPRAEWLAGASDLFVATNYLPPPTRSRGMVLVVHDLAFETMPETAPHHDERWRRSFARCLRRCSAVIVPSDATRLELFAHHEVDHDKVTVVAHGTDADAFSPVPPPEVEAVRGRFGIPGPYVVFLGGLEPRKNLERLIQAFGMVEQTDVSLVIVGGAVRWAPAYAAEVDAAVAALSPGARARVVRVGYVDDVDRRALLSGAEILAYPSRAEGFGFPVLEGFAAGVPVLTSSVASLPEVAGDAALLVDPNDADAIGDGLGRLFADPTLRERLVAAGRERLASFSWERAAGATAEVLRGAAGRSGGAR